MKNYLNFSKVFAVPVVKIIVDTNYLKDYPNGSFNQHQHSFIICTT
jgi:hypothetical protein